MIFASIQSTQNKSKWVNKKFFVIRHHTTTAEGTAKSVIRRFCTASSLVSCHYVIDEFWWVHKIWEHNDILRHAGVSQWKGHTNLNDESIGIEVVGPLKNWWFTEAQIKALWELTAYIMAEENIDISCVLRHKDIAPGRKTDITDTLWNNKYKTFEEAKIGIISSSFSICPDVPEWERYSESVKWAIDNGITSASKTVPFYPNKQSTRAEVIQFLYNYHKKYMK